MSEHSDVLQVEYADHVTTLRLNRPQALNAISSELSVALREALAQAERDDDTRAVILTGNGRGFCAGADLDNIANEMATRAPGSVLPAAEALEFIRRDSVPLVETIMRFSKPLVAAVNGPCAGAGVGLALAADVIVASDAASFSVVFSRRGLVPDFGVTHLLPRLIGLRKARELCLLGDRLSAEDALAIDLVNEVVTADKLDAVALSWATRFAQGPGVALRLTKRLLAESFEMDGREAVEREFMAQALCFTTADAVEGVAAFLQKRTPNFTGR